MSCIEKEKTGCRVVDRGPNWLFVHAAPECFGCACCGGSLVGELWDLSAQHFVYRLVLEMDEVRELHPEVAEQLRDLHDRLVERGGALRLCGLRPALAQRLLADAQRSGLHNHATRRDAIIGAAPVDAPPPRAARRRPASRPEAPARAARRSAK